MRPTYDQLATYDQLYTDAVSVGENSIVGSLIREYFLDGVRILDLGCGSGLALELLKERHGSLGVSLRWHRRRGGPGQVERNSTRMQMPSFTSWTCSGSRILAMLLLTCFVAVGSFRTP